MEEPAPHRYQPQRCPVPTSEERPLKVQRKPVAAPSAAYLPTKEVSVDEYNHYTRRDTSNIVPLHHAPVRPTSLLTSLRTRWTRLKKRTRIIIGAAILSAVLIIGLFAGIASRSRTSNLPLPNDHGGPYSGDLTYYDPALGACGLTNNDGDSIVAVSHIIFDAVSVGSNPNANPLCGKKIRARRGGKSIDLTVVDRCTGCQATDIDVTRSVFKGLANIDEGRVDVEWSWLEDVPGTDID